MTGKFRKFAKKLGTGAKNTAVAGATFMAAQNASALDSNLYFRLTPVDSISSEPGIQWIIGSSNNYVNVEMRAGADISINLRGIDLKYRDPDFTTNGFLIANASAPDTLNVNDIFYGKSMYSNLLSTNNGGTSTRLVAVGESGVPAASFINNYGQYGAFQISLASWLTNSYNITNAGRLLSTGFTINTDDLNFPSGQYPTSLVKIEASPSFNEIAWVPEPSSAALLGLGAGALAASRRRRNHLEGKVSGIRNSQVPSHNNQRGYTNRGSRRS